MNESHRDRPWPVGTAVRWMCCVGALGMVPAGVQGAEPVAGRSAGATAHAFPDDECGEFARKSDLLHGREWQQAIAELGSWLATQSVYSPAEVRRIKSQFNSRVAAMSSYDLEYLLDSISAKLRLLETPEARDAKAWLGEYLSAMSDARRAQELRDIPHILDMSAEQLWREIQRIDSLRSTLRQRQQGVEARQATLAERAAAGRQETSAASRAAAARSRAAPSHSPYRSGGGSAPFSDVQPRRVSVVYGTIGMF
jgi:hypothetical protein